jgi:HEAT repeat protein
MFQQSQQPQPPAPQAATPKPVVIPPMVDPRYGTAAQIMALPPAKLIAILREPDVSEYAKAKACQKLALTGDRRAVPALASLLTDERLSHYARFALEPNPDPSAGAALRDALGTVKGKLLIGVINSIGVRRDGRAIDPLARFLHDEDPAIAQAASAALARIRPAL